MAQKNIRSELLELHGISEDPYDYLEAHEGDADVGTSPAPDVYVRGSVPLMLDRTISRDEVEARFKKLKYL